MCQIVQSNLFNHTSQEESCVAITREQSTHCIEFLVVDLKVDYLQVYCSSCRLTKVAGPFSIQSFQPTGRIAVAYKPTHQFKSFQPSDRTAKEKGRIIGPLNYHERFNLTMPSYQFILQHQLNNLVQYTNCRKMVLNAKKIKCLQIIWFDNIRAMIWFDDNTTSYDMIL